MKAFLRPPPLLWCGPWWGPAIGFQLKINGFKKNQWIVIENQSILTENQWNLIENQSALIENPIDFNGQSMDFN